jgi:hypothetical protein
VHRLNSRCHYSSLHLSICLTRSWAQIIVMIRHSSSRSCRCHDTREHMRQLQQSWHYASADLPHSTCMSVDIRTSHGSGVLKEACSGTCPIVNRCTTHDASQSLPGLSRCHIIRSTPSHPARVPLRSRISRSLPHRTVARRRYQRLELQPSSTRIRLCKLPRIAAHTLDMG